MLFTLQTLHYQVQTRPEYNSFGEVCGRYWYKHMGFCNFGRSSHVRGGMKAAALLLTVSFCAAEPYNKHNVRVGLGAAQPRADLKRFFDTRVATEVGYGYRFHPWFQLDAGLDTVYGAGGVKDYIETALGDLRIRDYQFIVPLGGRVIVPLVNDRIHLQAGGGGAYLRYTERLRQPFDYARFDCSVCTARDGWAGYGLLGANVALDRYRHLRIGVSSKVYRGNTDGERLGAVPPVKTRDHWLAVFGELTLSF